MQHYIAIGYSIEEEGGVMPVDGYTVIEDIEYISGPNEIVNKCEFNILSNDEYDKVVDMWDSVIRKYNDSVKENKKMWFSIMVLPYTHRVKATYFIGEPFQKIEYRPTTLSDFQQWDRISVFIKRTSDLIVSNPPKIKT